MLRRRPPDAPTLTDRAAPLIEEAAERSRVSWRTRVERLRLAWRSIFQVAVSAGIAWLIATEVLGHRQPFFAPVAAIITLGLTVSQRGRRAAELAFGVALGIAVADLLVLGIGTGAAQLAIVVALATATAIFLGSGQLMATQAAVSAALVATLQPPTSGITFTRFFDALVGGGTALLVNALLLPAHPVRMVRQRGAPRARGARRDAGGRRRRGRAPRRASSPRPRWSARGASTSSARCSPRRSTSGARRPATRRRGAAPRGRSSPTRTPPSGSTSRCATSACWRAARSGRCALDDNVPPEIAGALRDLAVAVRALGPALDAPERADEVREPALRAAAEATLVLERTGNLSVSVIVGQVRSTATDLLASVGDSFEDASEAVRRAAREAEERA